jgi:mannose-6-phosphate isomerase
MNSALPAPGYPLVFERRLLEKVWGAQRLAGFLGDPRARGRTIGESWELSDHPSGESAVANGPWRGRTLRELMTTFPREIAGRVPLSTGDRFPLLVKFVDTSDRLSVQVHPSDADAARLGESDGGKNEAWFIVKATDDAQLWVGLAPGKTGADFAKARDARDFLSCMRELRPRSGEAIAIRAGTLHAIGAGVTVCEVQQTSDITYRVYDWDRPETPARPLHRRQSFEVLDFSSCPEVVRTGSAPPNRMETLPSPGIFRWSVARSTAPFEGAGRGMFQIAIGIGGEGRIYSKSLPGESVRLQPGVVSLVPASVENVVIEPLGELQWIHVTPAVAGAA